MNAFDIPRNFIAVLAALILTLALSAVPSVSAFAQEMSTVKATVERPVPSDASQLRHLLSKPDLSTEEQRLLDRALNDVYEELADASTTAAPSKTFIQSVNDLLGVKTGSDGHPHARG